MVDFTLRGQHQEALHLLRSGNYIEAMARCRQILHAFPKHIGTYLVLGRMYLQLGEHEEAANLFRRVLSADPESAVCYASMGAIYDERGLLDEAIWQLERALELSPGNREIRRELRRLYEDLQQGPVERIKPTRSALARAYLRGQLYPKAIGEIRVLLKDEPYRYDLRVALMQALWLDGRHDEAELVSQGILADLPNCLKANLILGHLWLNTGRDEEARTLFQRAQVLDPDNIVAQAIFGQQSPLPPRVARLPVSLERQPPWELPYLLLDDAEGVESEAPAPSPPMLGVAARNAAFQEKPQRTTLRPPPQLPPDASSSWAAPEDAQSGSLLERYQARLEDAPNDYGARLELARRLRDIGAINRAIIEYETLVREHPETWAAVALDLQLLNRLYPGKRDLIVLLIELEERGMLALSA